MKNYLCIVVALWIISAINGTPQQDPDYRKIGEESLWTKAEAKEWLESAKNSVLYANERLKSLKAENIGADFKGDKTNMVSSYDSIIESYELLKDAMPIVEKQLEKGELRVAWLALVHDNMKEVGQYFVDYSNWWPMLQPNDDDNNIERSVASIFFDDAVNLLADAEVLDKCLWGVFLWHEGDLQHPVTKK